MPYRRVDTKVQVKKGSQWVTLKTHPTVKKAEVHLAALQINVEHKGSK